MFQTFDSRMRRAVQQENRNIQASLSSSSTSSLATISNRSKKNPQPKTTINFCLVLIVLSPIAVVLVVREIIQSYSSWTVRQQELAILVQSAEQEVARMSKSDSGNIRKSNNGQQQNSNFVPTSGSKHHLTKTTQTTLVLTTEYGMIRIVLIPDLSPGSVGYIRKLVESGTCQRCNFYRSDKPGILQGVMASPEIPVNRVRGDCPEGLRETIKNECPEWDKQCGCHGPIMTQGTVAWAGGQAGGPDFFIDNYEEPAKFWGTQHTNFGIVQDEDSFSVIRRIFDLPVNKNGMMSMLEKPIHFEMSLEPASTVA